MLDIRIDAEWQKYLSTWIVCVIFCVNLKVSAETTSYAMQNMCGRRLNMAKLRNHSLAVSFLRVPSFFSTSCDLAIDSGSNSWAEDVTWNKILFQFLDFQNLGDSCVYIRQTTSRSNWDKASETIKGLKGSYCAGSQPPLNQPFTTNTHKLLVIKFDAESFLDDDPISFKLVANVLHSDGSCSQYECDNGNCIPKELRCSQYNPCGDNSHCKPEPISVQTIIFIVIGVTAGLLLIVLAVKYVRCKRKSHDEDADVDAENVTSAGQMTSLQSRSGNQGLRTPTAPELVGEHDDEDNSVEQTRMMVKDDDMPPPSYEEVMASQQR